MDRSTSSALIQRAMKSIPGGVNSPVRAFKGVGGDPVFFVRGEGARLFDVDDNEYIDYVASWGPMILGHSHKDTVAAVIDQAGKALGFGAPTEGEIDLAETCPRLHGSRPHHQVQRLLPRPFGLTVGQGG